MVDRMICILGDLEYEVRPLTSPDFRTSWDKGREWAADRIRAKADELRKERDGAVARVARGRIPSVPGLTNEAWCKKWDAKPAPAPAPEPPAEARAGKLLRKLREWLQGGVMGVGGYQLRRVGDEDEPDPRVPQTLVIEVVDRLLATTEADGDLQPAPERQGDDAEDLRAFLELYERTDQDCRMDRAVAALARKALAYDWSKCVTDFSEVAIEQWDRDLDAWFARMQSELGMKIVRQQGDLWDRALQLMRRGRTS